METRLQLTVLWLLLLCTEMLPVIGAPTACQSLGGYSWSVWSQCSRSCGVGVSTRTAHCLDGQCSSGSKVEYRSCCAQVCQSSTAGVDFREQQCGDRTAGLPGEWTLTHNATLDCSLNCENDRGIVFVSTIVDGTPCHSGGICLGSLCVVLGCDGVLGSSKVEDKCMRCLSPSDTHPPCIAVHATVQPSTTTGTVQVVDFPVGAASIVITHALHPNSGSLSVSGESSNLIGADAFSYEVTPDGEEVWRATGPLSQLVIVKLKGVNGTSPHVSYEYHHTETRPQSDKMPSAMDPPMDGEYSWAYGCYDNCSVDCGSGISVARPVCRDSNYPDRLIPDAFCEGEGNQMPAPLVKKCNTQLCLARWVVGDWSGCVCRDSEVRQITCQQPTNEKASSAVGDALCSHLPKPESLRECFTSCETQWNIGTWSKCMCGESRSRTAFCMEVTTGEQVNTMYCNQSNQPSTEEACPCSTQCTWLFQRWKKCSNTCGSGVQFGVLKCKNTTSGKKVPGCCEGQVKPADPVRDCYDDRRGNCEVKWHINMMKCVGNCCGQQTQEVEYVCGADQGGEIVIFPPEWCEGLERPPPEPLSSCPSSECVEWSVGEWGVCPCGGLGFRNRKVSCVRGDSEVDPEVCSQCFGPVSSVQVCNGVTPCTEPPPPTQPLCVDTLPPDICHDVPRPCAKLHREACCASCL
ncbi:A disintegrin and metalloproteinase with thrombospondin motifs 7-like [Halichondria panicea]|uniref:A disintegrin and metalloproteinase with thrombospondin motifs 7-like n=1 Tax=Halichondria panicea TaxID=6063 RepID=UPI00312B61AE